MVNGPTNYGNFGTPGQASPYGAPRVNVTSTIPAGSARTRKSINWGGVIKAVAIITAVAVVAVVGYVALQAAGAYLVTQMALPTPLGMVASGFVEAGNWIMGGIKIASDFVVGAASTFVGPIGATANTAAAAGLAANTSAIGITGAVAGAAVVAPTAITSLKSIALSTNTPIDPIIPPAGGAPLGGGGAPLGGGPGGNPSLDPTAHGSGFLSSMNGNTAAQAHSTAHTLHDLSHHAAEHGNAHNNSTRWADRFTSNNNNLTSHVDAVGGRKVTSSFSPRTNDSYTDQLNADRLNLEASLGKTIL